MPKKGGMPRGCICPSGTRSGLVARVRLRLLRAAGVLTRDELRRDVDDVVGRGDGAGTSGTGSGGGDGGNGGAGRASSLTGTAVMRAGGGAGRGETRNGSAGMGGGGAVGAAGTPKTGGGGGAGAAGGSGLVIVRYRVTAGP